MVAFIIFVLTWLPISKSTHLIRYLYALDAFFNAIHFSDSIGWPFMGAVLGGRMFKNWAVKAMGY